MSRQNFYKKRKKRQRQKVDEEFLLKLVRRERNLQPRLGGRKLLKRIRPDLEKAGVQIGRDRFFDLLRRHDLLVPPPRRRGGTTESRHRFRKYGNRLKDLEITAPHEAWVSDLTYINSDEGNIYLSLVTDDFSRKIVGWKGSDGLEAEGCMRSLKQAIEQLPKGSRPTHHSDRGIQYCCHAYVELEKAHGIQISMTEENHCYENAKAERVIGVLKQEYGLGDTFRTKKQARKAIEQAIYLYNEKRPHMSLDYVTPAEVHRQAA